MSKRKKDIADTKREPSAAREEVPFEGKEIGRSDPPSRGAEQHGPGMNQGRGSAGSTSED